jgi:ribonuclease BN (tRNA processing enzyme)
MAHLGLDWPGITHVVLTHFHADHTADLVALLTAWRYGQLPPRSAPVAVVGPPGTRRFFDLVAATFAPDLATFVPGLEVHEVPAGKRWAAGAGVELECLAVPHTAESVAWRVTDGTATITCSGDTGPSAALGAWATGSDLLLLECSLPAAFGVPIHLSPEDCADIAERARPGHLWLNHFYPPVEALDIEGIIARRWDGAVTRASDGLTIDLAARNATPGIGYRNP